jgi:hypothetical protein
MFWRERPFICCFFIPTLLIFLLAFAISCSEQPTGVQNQPGDTGGFTGKGRIDPGTGDKFLLGTVEDTTFAAGYIEVWAMDVAYDSSTGNVSFDVQLGNYTEWPIPAPIHFVIISVVPSDISALDFDGISKDGFPFYDFSSKLGSDNILEPGEISDRVTLLFHTGEPRSFSIGFRIDFGPAPDTGIITGVVFRDDNRNGVRDRCGRCEPGISGIAITMQRGFEESAENLFITHTDANGEYRFSNLKEGVYTVRAQAPPALWEITSPNPLLVTLIKGSDGKVQDFYGANFGLFPRDGLTLFGPIHVGPTTPHESLLDSTFVDPPSILPVVFTYYLEAVLPPIMGPFPVIVDSAAAWINGVQVFEFSSTTPPGSVFIPQRIELPPGLVHVGVNDIRLYANKNQYAIVQYRVFRDPF